MQKINFFLTYLNFGFKFALKIELLVALKFPDETQDTAQLVSLLFLKYL